MKKASVHFKDISWQNWIPSESLSYGHNEKSKITSRIYAVIGASLTGQSFVKFRGFGPEFKELIKELNAHTSEREVIGTDIFLFPQNGKSSLDLLKTTARIGRDLGFQYGAEVKLQSINNAIDIFSDGTLMGHVVKKNKIANTLYRRSLIAGRLITASNAEQEAEKLLRKILPDSPYSGIVHAVGGYVRDELLSQMYPDKATPSKDLDAVVEMKGGAKKVTHYLHSLLKNSEGKPATHSPHELGAGYPIWSLSFLKGEEGNAKIGDTVFFTSGAELELADTQKEAFPDPESRQRVTTHGTLEEDVKRRDFTVNMLLKDLTTGEIKDVTGVSKKDLKAGVLKGHPDVDLNQIFSDDPLRMIRLVRFKAKYDWSIPQDVKEIVKNNAHRLNIVSSERIREELIKIISYGKLKEAINLMKEVGFDKVDAGEELNAISFLLDKLKTMDISHDSKHHIDTEDKKDDKVIDHTLNVIDEAQNTIEAQLAALLHDIGKPESRTVSEEGKVKFLKHEEAGLQIAEDILRKFKFQSKTISKVLFLIENHMRPHSLENASDKALRKFIRDMGDNLDDVLDLAKADSEGKNPSSPYIDKLRIRINKLQNAVIAPTTKAVINGKEVMDLLNIKPGPEIGKINDFVLDMQDENPELTKDEAKKAILDKFKK